MADAWDSPWNEYTTTIATAIDNNAEEYQRVLGEAKAIIKNEVALSEKYITTKDVAVRIELAQALQKWYWLRIERRTPPESKHFIPSLMGMLLNEVWGDINWHGLAEHYLSTAKEEK